MQKITDEGLIENYFNSPQVVVKLNLELGFTGKVNIDWQKRIVEAVGDRGGKIWKLDDMLEILRESEFNEGPGSVA